MLWGVCQACEDKVARVRLASHATIVVDQSVEISSALTGPIIVDYLHLVGPGDVHNVPCTSL